MAQYKNYGGGANPFDDRGGGVASPGYPQSPPYNNGPAMGRDDYGGQNVEMASLAQNGQQFGQQADPNFILNRCREIDVQIDEAAKGTQALETLRSQVAGTVDQAVIGQKLDEVSSYTMAQFRTLIEEISVIKRMPESGSPRNVPQIGRVQRKAKKAMEEYRAKEQDFKNAVRDQMRREYRIVNGDATEAEVAAAVPDAEPQQMFQQAMMTSNRQGQANTTLNAVRQRNEAIKKIERDVIQLAELFSEMENLVVQQEAAVVNIEQKGEEVVENMDKGVEQMGVAIESAKSRNRKKWWCLGICVLIVVIIVIIVLVYKFVIQGGSSSSGGTTTNNSSNKRSILPETKSAPVIPGTDFKTSDRLVVPGLKWTESKLVIAGVAFSEDKAVVSEDTVVRKWKPFVA